MKILLIIITITIIASSITMLISMAIAPTIEEKPDETEEANETDIPMDDEELLFRLFASLNDDTDTHPRTY